MTWLHSAPLKLDTNTLSEDLKKYGVEVALGNVPGVSDAFSLGLNRNVGTTLEDVWGAGVDIVFPTAGERWEVLSDNANDTVAGGSGAQVALLVFLDTNYDQQSEIILLNGTTPVLSTSTNIFRPSSLITVASGSTGSNEGAIISRVAGGGATRNYIHPNFGISFDGHITIPRATTGLLTTCQVNAGRGDGIEFRLLTSIGAVTNFGVILYNNIFETATVTVLPVPITLTEKTDLIMRALNSGSGSNADCFAACQFLFIENE